MDSQCFTVSDVKFWYLIENSEEGWSLIEHMVVGEC